MKSLFRHAWIVVLAVLLAPTVACGDRRSDEQRLQDARASLESHDYRAAVIDLKNVLRGNPDNVSARLALGEALLQLSDNEGAEKELSKARELGASVDDYAVPIARAWIRNGAHQVVLAELDPATMTDSETASVVTALRGAALLEMGSVADAEAVFDRLIATEPSPEATRLALLGKARLASRRDQLGQAESLVRRSLDFVPGSAESTLVLGQILLSMENFSGAEEVFGYGRTELRGTTLEEFMLGAGEVEALLGQDKNVVAKERAAALVKSGMRHPMARYMLARALTQNGEPEQAAEELRKVLSKFPGFTAAQVLLGAVTLELGDLDQAELALVPVLSDQPNNATARRLLAEVRMRMNRPDEAAETLRGGGSDPRSLNMLARAEFSRGESGSAIELLEQSLEQDPDNLQTRFSLISAYVSDGQAERAKEMINALPEDAIPPQRREAMLLVADIDRSRISQSVPQIEELVERWPDDTAVISIAAGLYVAGGLDDKARALYTRLHEMDPDDFGIISSIARLDLRSGNYDAADALFEGYLANHPDSIDAMLALARVANRKGDDKRQMRFVRQAHETNPEALAPNLLLTNASLGAGDLEAARRYAEAALAANPNSAAAQVATGMVESSSGNLQAALERFRTAAELQPRIARSHYLKGVAEVQLGMNTPARNSFRKVLDIDGDAHRARRALMMLDARAGEMDSAESQLAELKERQPNSAETLEAEGDLRAQQGRAEEASAAYRRAAEIQPSQRLARRDFELRKGAGLAQPLAPLQAWLETEPDDTAARLLYAQELQASGAMAAAIEQYEALLERDAGGVLAKNNLAWLYLQQPGGDANDRALDLARQAHEAAPDNAQVADTYGWVLFKTGRRDEAREVLETALGDNAPASQPDIAYHLAEVLHDAGDTIGARRLLDDALKNGQGFYSKAAAEALRNRL